MLRNNSSFKKALEAALGYALFYLEGLDRTPVAATIDLPTLRRRLGRHLQSEGLPPDQVITDLVKDVDGGILGSAGGRFFAWVIGGSVPAALAADWLAATWDQNAALYACSPAAAVTEEVAGKWLKEILCLPKQASFAFVSGCQMAHVTCLAAARHELLSKLGGDVEHQGLYGAPSIRVLSGQRHGSVDRAIRLLGLGQRHIENLPQDTSGRVDTRGAEKALRRNIEAPTILILQAGDINTGCYDDFETIIPIAHLHGAWVHVDGAFGIWAATSPRLRHLVRGVEAADSWATDGHKWLNVPYDCGYAFVAHPEPHRAAMSHRAAYLIHDEDARDQIDWNPEWSRRGRGFSTYAALRQLGRNGVAALVERCCDSAHAITTLIGNLQGAEVLWQPVINQGLVRFLDPRDGATDEDHDRWTDKVIAAIVATGEAFFGPTTWRGRRAMRISVCNWQTSQQDVNRAVEATAMVLEELRR